MTRRYLYHPESHTTKSTENIHHAWEVQNILLDPPQSSVITSTSTEEITNVHSSFLARGTAGLKGSTANAADLSSEWNLMFFWHIELPGTGLHEKFSFPLNF